MTHVRLNKALALYGICARRKADNLIISKRVKVNNVLIEDLSFKLDIDKDKIFLDNKLLIKNKNTNKVYYILNKPEGYVCSNKSFNNQKIVFDLFKKAPAKNLFTAGRLDKNTAGLLIVTNDGDFGHQLMHPSSNIIKEYIVKTLKKVTKDQLLNLRKGMKINKELTKPVFVKKTSDFNIKIGVKEGKKHEVRLFCKNANIFLGTLKRVRIGHLTLKDLPKGSYRNLTEKEKKFLL